MEEGCHTGGVMIFGRRARMSQTLEFNLGDRRLSLSRASVCQVGWCWSSDELCMSNQVNLIHFF